jgi:hypothetical protein
MDSGIAALAGAFLGGIVTFFINWLQQHHQTKREFIKIAHDLAKEDYNTAKEFLKGGGKMMPIEGYLAYYMEYIKIIQSKNFKIKDLNKIRRYHEELHEFYREELSNKI